MVLIQRRIVCKGELLILPVGQSTTLAKAGRLLVLPMLVVSLLNFNHGKLYLLLLFSLSVGSKPIILALTPIHPQRGRAQAHCGAISPLPLLLREVKHLNHLITLRETLYHRILGLGCERLRLWLDKLDGWLRQPLDLDPRKHGALLPLILLLLLIRRMVMTGSVQHSSLSPRVEDYPTTPPRRGGGGRGPSTFAA